MDERNVVTSKSRRTGGDEGLPVRRRLSACTNATRRAQAGKVEVLRRAKQHGGLQGIIAEIRGTRARFA